jgi:hypothetical protein
VLQRSDRTAKGDDKSWDANGVQYRMVCSTEFTGRGWKSVICNAVVDTVFSDNQILTMALHKRDVCQENGSVLR